MSSELRSLSSTGISFSRMDEKEKQQALEEEQARLQALKVTARLFIPPNYFRGGSIGRRTTNTSGSLRLCPFPFHLP